MLAGRIAGPHKNFIKQAIIVGKIKIGGKQVILKNRYGPRTIEAAMGLIETNDILWVDGWPPL